MHSAVRGRRVRFIREGGGGSFMSLKDVHLRSDGLGIYGI